MEKIFQDEKRIKSYAQIQKSLCLLEQNSDDDKINEVIQKIPKEFLTQKDNLMILCQLFVIFIKNKFST